MAPLVISRGATGVQAFGLSLGDPGRTCPPGADGTPSPARVRPLRRRQQPRGYPPVSALGSGAKMNDTYVGGSEQLGATREPVAQRGQLDVRAIRTEWLGDADSRLLDSGSGGQLPELRSPLRALIGGAGALLPRALIQWRVQRGRAGWSPTRPHESTAASRGPGSSPSLLEEVRAPSQRPLRASESGPCPSSRNQAPRT